MTAARWRRFPFTRIRVWSGAMLRRLTGRTTVAASLIGCVLTLNDGTTVRNWLVRSTSPWLRKSWAVMTSIGTAEAVTDRGSARVPTTTTCSTSPPNTIATSRVAVAPALTSTTCVGTVKPKRVNVTSYVPGTSPLNMNWPVPSVTVACVLPAASCASAVTPGRTPPVVSVTAPEIVPSWALATPGTHTTAANRSPSAKPADLDVKFFEWVMPNLAERVLA